MVKVARKHLRAGGGRGAARPQTAFGRNPDPRLPVYSGGFVVENAMRRSCWLLPIVAGLIPGFLGPVWARGEAYSPAQVPAGARWVIHFDADAARASQVGQALLGYLEAHPHFREQAAEIERFAGLKLSTQLHGILLFGRRGEGSASVMLIHAPVDGQLALRNLRGARPGLTTTTHGPDGHAVHGWQDGARQVHVCFYSPILTLVAQSREELAAELDVLDGRAPALDGASPLAAKPAPGTLLYLVTDHLQDLLKQAGHEVSPLLEVAEGGSLALGEFQREVFLSARLLASAEDVAAQAATALEGLRALMQLAARAPASPRPVLEALQSAVIVTRQRWVHVDVRVEVGKLLEWAAPWAVGSGPGAGEEARH
jgi:hypothetical protein